MKLKKKFLAFTLAAVTVITPITAYADNGGYPQAIEILSIMENGVAVTVEDGFTMEEEMAGLPFRTDKVRGISKPTTESSVDMNRDTGNVQYSSLIYGNKLLYGATTLKVKVTNQSSTVDQKFTITLYNKDGVKIDSLDCSIGKKVIGLFNNKTATFSNLNANTRYYFTLTQSSGNSYDQSYDFGK